MQDAKLVTSVWASAAMSDSVLGHREDAGLERQEYDVL